MLLITGPNMAGKSTKRQVARLCDGSDWNFVPADSAALASAIEFYAVGASDDLARGSPPLWGDERSGLYLQERLPQFSHIYDYHRPRPSTYEDFPSRRRFELLRNKEAGGQGPVRYPLS